MSAVQSAMSSLVERLWYGSKRPLGFLAPLSWLYRSIAEARRRAAWDARDASLLFRSLWLAISPQVEPGSHRSPSGWSLNWHRLAGGQ